MAESIVWGITSNNMATRHSEAVNRAAAEIGTQALGPQQSCAPLSKMKKDFRIEAYGGTELTAKVLGISLGLTLFSTGLFLKTQSKLLEKAHTPPTEA